MQKCSEQIHTPLFLPSGLTSVCYLQSMLLTSFQELLRHVSYLWCTQTAPDWQIKVVCVSGWVTGNNGRGMLPRSDTGKRKWSQQMCLFSFPLSEINIISVCLRPGFHLTIIPFPFTLIGVRSHLALVHASRNQTGIRGKELLCSLLLGLQKVWGKRHSKSASSAPSSSLASGLQQEPLHFMRQHKKNNWDLWVMLLAALTCGRSSLSGECLNCVWGLMHPWGHLWRETSGCNSVVVSEFMKVKKNWVYCIINILKTLKVKS